ncbi:MAG: UDP-N-acetylmuramate dehydrogenase [Bacteroidales bacterium]
MEIIQHTSLQKLNTFGIDVDVEWLVRVASPEDLPHAASLIGETHLPGLVIGGGSNILPVADFRAVVLEVGIPGIEVLEVKGDRVRIFAGAGIEWDYFVDWCLAEGYFGLENLSLIPGRVGAAPVQNIGAYGVEVQQFVKRVHYYDLQDNRFQEISGEECRFGYRDSVFKHELKGRIVITGVEFELSLKPHVRIHYGGVAGELAAMGITEPHPRQVREAVVRIRRRKLPDPAIIGNAGSFFKNPVVSEEFANELKQRFPGIVSYPQPSGGVKLAAGWLIDRCGWKGFRKGDAGVHANQALVLVNYGKASGKEIFDLSVEIQESVKSKFGVSLEREVLVIGNSPG